MKIKDQLEAIKKIDADAEKYVREIVLPRYDENFLANLEQKGLEVLDLFLWQKGCTPQGRPYWFDIWKQLREKINEAENQRNS